MSFFKCLIMAIICIFSSSFVVAEDIPELTWDDLVPSDLQDPLAKFSQDDQELIDWIIYLRENLPEKVTKENRKLHEILAKSLPILKESGIDIDELISRRRKMATTVVQKLNNKKIRMPGYLLPLETSNEYVTEFLLVPIIGACIHVPPPPPNQIINVTTIDKKGYKNEKLFEPVLVSGTISIQSLSKDLFLSDGTGDIDIGYTMKAEKITNYDGKSM